MLQLFAVVFGIALLSQIISLEVAPGAYTGLLITTLFYLLIFFVIFALLRRGGEGLSNLGFRTSGLGALIALASVLAIVAQFIWWGLLWAATGNLAFNFGALPPETFLVEILVMALLVGLVEESAFRGYIQRKLTKHGFAPALIVASFLFIIIHIQFYTILRLTDPSVMAQATQLGITEAQVWTIIGYGVTQTVIMITSLGFFLGYLYHKSNQSLLPPVLFHMVFNIGGLFMLSYSNAQLAVLSLGYGSFVVLEILWASIVGALVWVAAKISTRS